eukprot:scaffold126843_cov22-Tisochrysis_lutea.AAC.1
MDDGASRAGAFVNLSQLAVPRRCQGQLSLTCGHRQYVAVASALSSGKQSIKQQRPPSPSLQVASSSDLSR